MSQCYIRKISMCYIFFFFCNFWQIAKKVIGYIIPSYYDTLYEVWLNPDVNC